MCRTLHKHFTRAATRNRVFAIEVTVANRGGRVETRHDCFTRSRRKFSFIGSYFGSLIHRPISLGTRRFWRAG